MDELEILEELPEIHAGFPSPSQDYMKGVIDLNRELVRHPAATFYGRVVGDSMIEAGVREGDVLVIDKALRPSEGDLCVSCVDGSSPSSGSRSTTLPAAGSRASGSSRPMRSTARSGWRREMISSSGASSPM